MRRHLPYILVAVALLALNLGKWVFGGGSPEVPKQSFAQESVTPRDLVLRVVQAPTSDKVAARDLFFSKSTSVAERIITRPATPAALPSKTSDELAREQADSEFARLGVTGIVFRNGKGQAFVTRGEESFVVKVGEKVAERFEVIAIAADYVSLRDTDTGIEKQITLQGG